MHLASATHAETAVVDCYLARWCTSCTPPAQYLLFLVKPSAIFFSHVVIVLVRNMHLKRHGNKRTVLKQHLLVQLAGTVTHCALLGLDAS